VAGYVKNAKILYNKGMFRIITGIVVISAGAWFILASVREAIGLLIPGGIIIAIGITILLNTREDDIEEIKNNKKE